MAAAAVAAALPGGVDVDAEIAGFVLDRVIANKILQTLTCELNSAPTQAPLGLFTLSQVEQARRVLQALSRVISATPRSSGGAPVLLAMMIEPRTTMTRLRPELRGRRQR